MIGDCIDGERLVESMFYPFDGVGDDGDVVGYRGVCLVIHASFCRRLRLVSQMLVKEIDRILCDLSVYCLSLHTVGHVAQIFE